MDFIKKLKDAETLLSSIRKQVYSNLNDSGCFVEETVSNSLVLEQEDLPEQSTVTFVDDILNQSSETFLTNSGDTKIKSFVHCDYCDYKALEKSEASLRKHFKKIHPNELKVECDVCKKFFVSRDMVQLHLRKSRCGVGSQNLIADIFSCSYCQWKTKHESSFHQHLTKQHADKEMLPCVCGRKFYFTDTLRRHLQEKLCSITEKSIYHKQLQCDLCTFECSLQANIELHCKSMHPNYEWIVCECMLTHACKDLYKEHMWFNGGICKPKPTKGYGSCNKLVMSRDPKDQLVNCVYCSNVIRRRRLSHHCNDEHSEEQRMECIGCTTKFWHPLDFQEHLEHNEKCKKSFVNHPKEQSIEKAKEICPICGLRTFYMTKHLTLHELEPKFECDLCHKKYKEKTNLSVHMKKVHLKLAKFECPHCEETFQTWTSRRVHVIRVHTKKFGHSCHVCEKEFITKFQLKSHLNTHTGTKNFKCPVCYLPCSTKFAMERHIRRQHSN